MPNYFWWAIAGQSVNPHYTELITEAKHRGWIPINPNPRQPEHHNASHINDALRFLTDTFPDEFAIGDPG